MFVSLDSVTELPGSAITLSCTVPVEEGVQSSSTVVFSPGASEEILVVSSGVAPISSDTSKLPESASPMFVITAVIGFMTSFRRLAGVSIVVTVRSGCSACPV